MPNPPQARERVDDTPETTAQQIAADYYRRTIKTLEGVERALSAAEPAASSPRERVDVEGLRLALSAMKATGATRYEAAGWAWRSDDAFRAEVEALLREHANRAAEIASLKAENERAADRREEVETRAAEWLSRATAAEGEVASLKAAVEEARGALEAAESENEELRLLMLGGEDVPGVAASLSFDQVRQAHEDNRAMRVGRAESAERSVASLKAALETDAAKDVLAERRRQVETEGWTLAHDDEHAAGDMARAAACYALSASRDPNDHRFGPGCPPAYWPWDPRWWKPTLHRRRELVKAGALIIAEIERLDRLAKLPALNAATLSGETGK